MPDVKCRGHPYVLTKPLRQERDAKAPSDRFGNPQTADDVPESKAPAALRDKEDFSTSHVRSNLERLDSHTSGLEIP